MSANGASSRLLTMSSRTPLGDQQRQPSQRRLSASMQRPVLQVGNLSQQALPPSPIRKETRFHDVGPQTAEHSDGSAPLAPARPGHLRATGSKLKLEFSPLATTAAEDSEPSQSFSPPTSRPGMLVLEGGSRKQAWSDERGDGEPPLPMPPRPCRHERQGRERPAPPKARAAPRKDNRPKPYMIDAPSGAPRLAIRSNVHGKPATGTGQVRNGYADFFPWTGNHPEDQFSSDVIRNGYFDKVPAQTAASETGSARTVLHGVLKHKPGLHVLSSLFGNMLSQRRNSGLVTAPSTFKPPPRVMLTDTKREAWLRDLANPATPLRKASRTIPHGIRGKGLLEQCLHKRVPIDRAVWLAKCVGANEIRAFKRKGPGAAGGLGMGGEAKWVREWTVSIEQFVEGVVAAPSDDNWKTKVQYALQLTAHFYAEHLMDGQHFMDWLVSNLESTHQSRLPMWVLLMRLYWRDLLRLRKYGRRLVTALLSHLHVVHKYGADILAPLAGLLELLLNSLIVHSGVNFICPGVWFKYRETVRSCLSTNDEARQRAYHAINARNEQLGGTGIRSQPAARQSLIRMLDTTLQVPMVPELPLQCWNITPDKPAMVRALLQWCTSLHRPGLAKVYVTGRILHTWSAMGVDVTTAILDFLDHDAMAELDRKRNLYQLVCHLVRAHHFSVPRYVQWLIARGGFHSALDVEPDGPAATRLLVELPIHALPPSQRHMRATMLLRFFDADLEAEDIFRARRRLLPLLGTPCTPTDGRQSQKPLGLVQLTRRIAKSGQALKTDVGYWLRNKLCADVEQQARQGNHKAVTSGVFLAARAVLEAADDCTMLADVVRYMSRSSCVDTLALCVDTVSRHICVFAALGAPRDMFDAFHARLKGVVDEQGLGARPFLASLVGLAPRIPGLDELAAQLKRELLLSDRHHPVDACSPVSDNTAPRLPRLPDSDVEWQDEMEKLLANGTSVDPRAMGSLFHRLVSRMLLGCRQVPDKHRAYSVLLARLRVLDRPSFDAHMAEWLQLVRTQSTGPPVTPLLPLLVSAACLDLRTVLATAAADAKPGSAPLFQQTYRTRHLQHVLTLFTAPQLPGGLLTPEECYRFSVLQDRALKENHKELLVLVRNALLEYVFARSHDVPTSQPLDEAAAQNQMTALLRVLVLKDAPGVSRALAIKPADPHVAAWIETMTSDLLLPGAASQAPLTLDQLLQLTDELTLPFCQLKIFLSLSAAADQQPPPDSPAPATHLELLAKAMDEALAAGNLAWTGILPVLGLETTHYLRHRAQLQFLDLVPSLRNPCPAASLSRSLPEALAMAENLLAVIDAVAPPSSHLGRTPQLTQAMVERFADLWELLASSASTVGPDAKAQALYWWLPLVLALLTRHAQSPDSSKAGGELRARAVVVCAGLLGELDGGVLVAAVERPHCDDQQWGMVASSLPSPGQLLDRVFDFACLLVDHLGEDVRLTCARVLKDVVSHDAKVRYLLSCLSPFGGGEAGGAAGAGAGFVLCVRDKMQQQQQQQQQQCTVSERYLPFTVRRWEMLNDPTPVVGENDTALSMGLFEARKVR